jgi:DNA-binding MarR family transcriptional regulator
MQKHKTPKQMERHLKGAASHRRIEMILLIARRSGITLESIIEALAVNEKTAGEHVRRLFAAGLVNKRHRGRYVEHTLSPYGKLFVEFLKSLQQL